MKQIFLICALLIGFSLPLCADGEVDVLEALEHVKSQYQVDNARISVRGFSMGGAACWQFAVLYSDRWFAANPGAGFSETPEFLKFFQKEKLKPYWWEEKLWRWYDADDSAINLFHAPTVAYSGEKDIQKQAARIDATILGPSSLEITSSGTTGLSFQMDQDFHLAIEMA